MVIGKVGILLMLLAGLNGGARSGTLQEAGDELKPVVQLLQDNKMSEAIAAIDPLLAGYETRYKAEKSTIFCGFGPTESLLYMALASSAQPSGMPWRSSRPGAKPCSLKVLPWTGKDASTKRFPFSSAQ